MLLQRLWLGFVIIANSSHVPSHRNATSSLIAMVKHMIYQTTSIIMNSLLLLLIEYNRFYMMSGMLMNPHIWRTQNQVNLLLSIQGVFVLVFRLQFATLSSLCVRFFDRPFYPFTRSYADHRMSGRS